MQIAAAKPIFRASVMIFPIDVRLRANAAPRTIVSPLKRAQLLSTTNRAPARYQPARSSRGGMMTGKQAGAFGSWNSPITADAVVGDAVSLAEPRVDGDAVYWVEGRPREKGRSVVVRAVRGDVGDVTPAPFDARSQVHSYGGGAYAVRGGTLYFAHFAHNQALPPAPGGPPAKLTSSPACLFAEICMRVGP